MVRKAILVGVLVLLPVSTSSGQSTHKAPPKGTITLDLPFPRIKVVSKRTVTKKRSKPAALRPRTIRSSKTKATPSSSLQLLGPRATPQKGFSQPNYRAAPTRRASRPTAASPWSHSRSRVWTPIRVYRGFPNEATVIRPRPVIQPDTVNPPVPVPLATWRAPRSTAGPYSAPSRSYPAASYSPRPSKQSQREAAIAHLEAAAQLLKRHGNGKSVGAIRQVIAQQRQTALREMIAQKETQLQQLKKEIAKLSAGLQPRQVLVKMTVSKMDLDKVSKQHRNAIPTCCAKGKCSFHVVAAPADFQVDQHIRQLQKSGALKILARPQIMTLDGRMARFQMAMRDGKGNPVIGSLEIRPKIVSNKITLGVGLKCEIPPNPGQAYSRPVKSQHAAQLQCTIPSGQSALMSRVIRIGGAKKNNMALVITVTPIIVSTTERPLATGSSPHLPRLPQPVRPSKPVHREAQKKSVSDVIHGFFFGVTR